MVIYNVIIMSLIILVVIQPGWCRTGVAGTDLVIDNIYHADRSIETTPRCMYCSRSLSGPGLSHLTP